MALRLTMAQAARRLGVSHDAVRFVLKGQPAPPGAAKSAKWEGGAAVRRARAALPRDRFARFYLDEYRSLKWIAEHAGVNVDAIKALVREYGMTREGRATRRRQIDLDWLRAQRAAGRTCREPAEETGFSLAMISYLGRRHDTPGRPTKASDGHPHAAPGRAGAGARRPAPRGEVVPASEARAPEALPGGTPV
ncbi:hypothetical protein [Kitasatospora sp. NBC_01266]|uniref:hypothetical protein n=1 Tax=Kitasatospora sp. NBC_01266 TaxID=2903572 RepID=UPI002E368FA0|nr:hypothetical protein [Kitasatospora sp. NBC_01266]